MWPKELMSCIPFRPCPRLNLSILAILDFYRLEEWSSCTLLSGPGAATRVRSVCSTSPNSLSLPLQRWETGSSAHSRRGNPWVFSWCKRCTTRESDTVPVADHEQREATSIVPFVEKSYACADLSVLPMPKANAVRPSDRNHIARHRSR